VDQTVLIIGNTYADLRRFMSLFRFKTRATQRRLGSKIEAKFLDFLQLYKLGDECAKYLNLVFVFDTSDVLLAEG